MPVSSGRITKSRKSKNTPTHGKNHRWESFNSKISQIGALDPLHRVRRHDLDAEDISTTTSYFQKGLQRWSELCMARGFIAFKRQALPLCESLPQLLHFEARIMELLAEHIAAHEKESLEPLLELLTAFARDLGVRFEKHYGRALTLISGILAKPQEVEVVEWSFGSLAWLFKYLWRLLVPNLAPTYDALAPLLGKTRHTPHIARFAAEALSFLVKKAAAPSNRETALGKIVQHVRDDLYSMAEERQFTLYRDGVMLMFAEAIRGTGEAIHTSGPALARALLAALPETEREPTPNPIWTSVVCGSLTSVLHESNASSLAELVAAVVEHIKADVEQGPSDDSSGPSDDRPWRCTPWCRVLGTLAGVRRGSRVAEWPPLVEALVELLNGLAKARPNVPEDITGLVWQDIIVNAAVVWQQAPMDALIKFKAAFTQAMTREPCMRWFVPFCAYLDELDSGRFNSLFRQDFQKFIVNHWSDGKNESMLCVLLPRMSQSSSSDMLRLPQTWQDQIVTKFESLEATPFPERGVYDKDPQTWRGVCLPKYSALLRILECTAVHPSTNARISDLLLKKLKLALRPSSTIASDEVHFIISQGFKSYLRMTKGAATVDNTLGPLLLAAVPRFGQSVVFLEAFLEYEKLTSPGNRSGSEDSTTEEHPVFGFLVQNLASCSPELRLASLNLLQHLNTGPDVSSSIETMLLIEHVPVTISGARAFGMHIRKLALGYPHIDAQSWLARAVPSFLFGALTIKLSPVWDDATEAMKQISKTKAGEEAVCDLAFQWLDVPSPKWSGPASPPARWNALTPFDCTHLMKLTRTASELFGVFGQPETTMLRALDEQQQTAEPHVHNARSQALRVFGSIPELAEKRSRRVVPLFFSWADEEPETEIEEEPESNASADDVVNSPSPNWSLSDRKALLGIFGKFVNPRALYQHDRVYATLLELLKNGDTDVQKLVLKAILAWKQEGVKPYQENLELLLDETKFKNEVTQLLQNSTDGIKPEHRGELMPVLLRLLFGRSITKKGVRNLATGNRLAVIRNLSVEDMGSFLDIAVGRLRDIRVFDASSSQNKLFDHPVISIRNQYGFLNMIASLVTELGKNTSLYVDRLLNSIMYCIMYAYRQIKEINEVDAGSSDGDDAKAANVPVELLKSIRTAGLKSLNLVFQLASGYDWTEYRRGVMREVVCPRIEKLPIETAQGVSGILQLFSTWSQHSNTVTFFCEDAEIPSILSKIIECLAVEKGKDEVKVFVLNIIRSLVKVAVNPETDAQIASTVKTDLLEANSSDILHHITTILRSSGLGISLLEASIEAIVDLAPLLERSDKTASVLDIATFLLEQPPRRVSPKAKGRILLLVDRFAALFAQAADTPENAKIAEKLYGTLSSLFSYFKDRENREALARIFLVLADAKSELQEVATLVTDLNSFSKRRIDEPDYDRRLAAFALITKQREVPLSRHHWLPILHNLLFSIRANEEFVVLSSNSADGLRRFIENVVSCPQEGEKALLEQDLRTVLLPALYSGAKEESDGVRRNYLRVFGGLLMQMPEWGPIVSLKGLLDDVDEETAEPAFFFHVLSPATSRRLEALDLLEKANDKSEINSTILNSFFIPLLEHHVFGQPEENDGHGIGARAADIIGALARSLEWRHYRTTVQRFISYIEARPESLKRVVRLLGKTVDSLVLAVAAKAPAAQDPDAMVDEPGPSKALSGTLPADERFQTDILDNFVPALAKHVHAKDESQVSHRVPVGVIVVKMLKMLPEDRMNVKLGGVLTDICHILRSKAGESRDMARDTLAKISVVLGPSFFGFILKELRGALQKGYQLHILSYTLHSILVNVIPQFQQGDLDEWLSVMVTIIMDDIFGVTGQEKEAEGYTTDMKEIKSSKSQDSMELIARTSSIERLNALVSPLRDLLMEKVDLKLVRKIDILLTRIAAGLLQNPAANSRGTLILCYEVIQEFYNSKKTGAATRLDPKLRKYLYRKGASDIQKGMNAKHTYKLVRFSLEILRSTLKKHDDLRTSTNLTGFVPIFGDLIVAGEDEVKTAVFKLLPVIIKVPFNDSEESTKLFKVAAKEAVASISRAHSTTTDLAQAALKFVSVVLRDRSDVPIKDAAVDMLLGKVKDDLTQPLHRHVTFNFLRSVLDRKVETATVYDTIDYVGTVMITNVDKGTRDLARGAFFQFLREYPQKMARWSKQLNFIVANLKYEREGGRESVMEVVHLLLSKTSDDFVQEVAATVFLPLVFVLANDDSEKCRGMAAILVKEIFAKADTQRMNKFLSLMQSWVANDDNAAVMRLGVEAFALYFEAREGAVKDKASFQLALERASSVIETDNVAGIDADLANAALGVVGILATRFPARLLSPDSEQVWTGVGACSKHPDQTVKLSSINLVARYVATFKESGQLTQKGTIKGPHGIELDESKIKSFVRFGLNVLTGIDVNADVAKQAEVILGFLGPKLTDGVAAEQEELESGDDGEEAELDEDAQEATLEKQGNDLQYLFWRLSSILRKEVPVRGAAIIGKLSAMEVFEQLCRAIPTDRLRASLGTILSPVHQLTDRTIPTPHSTDDVFKAGHEQLKSRAQILSDALHKKFGTADFTRELQAVRERVRSRREQRSSKRKIEAVMQPERYGKYKQKKGERKKARHGVRVQDEKARRHAFKSW